ncbi:MULTISPECIES: hypothetical protein [unclassified Oceanobacter]|jgi:hypothetical protein|uniref:hypothetical protein n=1 Tax=unclassified Oceanobacter TaxID=2620260 RepID=UPI0026E12E2D|nr:MULTISPECIES: hypothetical protein [unclassified Oceanobacter]MDO6681923.1 hypothetical protein [Oceanobacter sp. 5_MG-2023]MDP2505285.1 hypothetical protein [Oceanobacter sp. 3_MG-2023]MDP2547959.1 hypothetical protein [Oceanobacter sp. 4_MG-2023]MDP2609884.1 hypothetical protein [Oceanobacter sp. 1_MG-2023]MDP2612238.1 hypothetical protein [Oceanobacter sp. 2_MG-2023]
MARVKQWRVNQQLSYLLFDPISRRGALIDPQPALVSCYIQTLEQLGVANAYLLFTGEMTQIMNIPGQMLDAGALSGSAAPDTLALGESYIRVVVDPAALRVAYVCDGLIFSGMWWLPGGLRPFVASEPEADVDKLPLLQLPDDYVLYPGRAIGSLCISSVAQEKALCYDPLPACAGAPSG